MLTMADGDDARAADGGQIGASSQWPTASLANSPACAPIHCRNCSMAPRRRQAAPSAGAAPASLASLPDALLERILGLLGQRDR